MITLNLLSPNKKQELRILRYFVFIKNVIFISLIFVIAISILLLIARVILENVYYSAIENNTLVSTSSNRYSQEIKAINLELARIARIQKDYVSMSSFVHEVMITLPPSIRLETLNVDVESKNVKIRGLAPTRDDLKAMVSALNSLGYFAPIEEPFSANFQRTNIDFDLDILVNQFPAANL